MVQILNLMHKYHGSLVLQTWCPSYWIKVPEIWEREGTRRVALAARCIFEPPSAETESCWILCRWSPGPADQRKQDPSWTIVIFGIANMLSWWNHFHKILLISSPMLTWRLYVPRSCISISKVRKSARERGCERKAPQKCRHCLFSCFKVNSLLYRNVTPS